MNMTVNFMNLQLMSSKSQLKLFQSFNNQIMIAKIKDENNLDMK